MPTDLTINVTGYADVVVSGKVLLANGNPSTFTYVNIYSFPDNILVKHIYTDSAGNYSTSLLGIQSGNYRINLSSYSYGIINQVVTLTQNQNYTFDYTLQRHNSAVKISKAVSLQEASSSDALTYIVTVQNPTSQAINDLTLSDIIPANSTYVPDSSVSNFTANPIVPIQILTDQADDDGLIYENGQLVYTIDQLGVGKDMFFAFKVQAN
jgi:uncharacterized repeat protein (TIGR01451 family)